MTNEDEAQYWAQMQAEAAAHEAEQAAANEAEYHAAMEEEQRRMSSEDEKAAIMWGEQAKKLWKDLLVSDDQLIQCFLAGVQYGRQKVTGETSDGYHTFDELYEHRTLLYLFCVERGIFKASYVVEDHYEGWDLIVSFTPTNYQQISYHVPNKYRWAYEKASRRTKEEQEKLFDGHNSKLVAHRIEMSLRHLDLPTPPEAERDE